MGRLVCDSAPDSHYRLQGIIGQRLAANVDNWLLRAPDANPGMIEMFRLRDRQPVPDLVPWAGEFVGKYLISAIQARRMTDRPELDAHLRRFIPELIATQADDGYLGPFRKEERLLAHWDLWGHYHCMLALMMWHEDTGDRAALDCAIRAGDLICATYLDTGGGALPADSGAGILPADSGAGILPARRRIIHAGSPEMNMAVIHALGRLHRHTGEERYLRMMREIETDWEQAGDYFRTGLAGKDFFRTPKPRWESLHDVQGLTELYLITGSDDYRTALANLWWSIAWYDRHNTGGFSTHERALGDPYALGAIETCCTTAWVALTVDMLRLTGDSRAADELEWSLFNSVLGSQHPSGRWWTYDTPMDGVRRASAHHIVFQARVGTPELNCCSANAPRGLGALSEWAVMRDEQGVFVNYYGPGATELPLSDGTVLRLRQITDYPVSGDVKLLVAPEEPSEFALRLRVPFWSSQTSVRVNGDPVEGPAPGRYVEIARRWQEGDTVELSLDMSLRVWPGERACAGKVSLFRGPLLLAFDQHFNELDTADIPPLDLDQLDHTPVELPARFPPLVLLQFTGSDGRKLNLCDFATAGAHGTHYASWLPAAAAGPGAFYLKRPRDGERIPPGPHKFEWTGPRTSHPLADEQTLIIARTPDCAEPIIEARDLKRCRSILREQLEPGTYYWRVTRHNEHGARDNEYGPQAFVVDAALENAFVEELELEFRDDGLVTASELDGDGVPLYGHLALAHHIAPAPDRHGNERGAVAFNGQDSKLAYRLPYFPEEDYTVLCWVCPEGLPTPHIVQIFSAWCAGGDDALRVTIEGDQVSARIEAGSFHATEGFPITEGEWFHVAAVKQADKLSLYVNGELRHTAQAPHVVHSNAEDFALGANPHFTGHEYFRGRIDALSLYARALTAAEIAAAYAKNTAY